VLGMQSMLVRGESIWMNLAPLGALALTTVLSLFVSAKLFRWEKDEKVKTSAKLWIFAVMVPFVVIGVYQLKTKENLARAKILERDLHRSSTFLIRDVRIFPGDGRIIDSGAILVRNGRITEIYDGNIPEAKAVKAFAIDAAGKTVLPGLVDTDVRFLPGTAPRALAAYIYCGVMLIRASGVPPDVLQQLGTGQLLGPDVIPGAASAPSSLVRGDVSPELLARSLVQQVVPREQLDEWRGMAASWKPLPLPDGFAEHHPTTIGTASGLPPLMIHGPLIHREMQLWAKAGVPPRDILLAATSGGAKALGRDNVLRKGGEASLFVVEGNPLEDIAATERIYLVLFKGERIDRQSLFEDFDKR